MSGRGGQRRASPVGGGIEQLSRGQEVRAGGGPLAGRDRASRRGCRRKPTCGRCDRTLRRLSRLERQLRAVERPVGLGVFAPEGSCCRNPPGQGDSSGNRRPVGNRVPAQPNARTDESRRVARGGPGCVQHGPRICGRSCDPERVPRPRDGSRRRSRRLPAMSAGPERVPRGDGTRRRSRTPHAISAGP